jgi:hypothetical protein
MVWFTAEEDIRLQRFVMEDLKAEVAMNTVCAEIVNMVLENENLRKQLTERIDGKVKQSWHNLICAWCGFSSKNVKGAEIHSEICRKRPLEVLISN